MKVICRVCEKNAQFNNTLGIYYCPMHGYETKLENATEYINDLVSTLEQLEILV